MNDFHRNGIFLGPYEVMIETVVTSEGVANSETTSLHCPILNIMPRLQAVARPLTGKNCPKSGKLNAR